jgi:hypothetical protein
VCLHCDAVTWQLDVECRRNDARAAESQPNSAITHVDDVCAAVRGADGHRACHGIAQPAPLRLLSTAPAGERRPHARKKVRILERSGHEGSAVTFRLAFSEGILVRGRDDDRDVGMIDMAVSRQLKAVEFVEVKIGDEQTRRPRIEQLAAVGVRRGNAHQEPLFREQRFGTAERSLISADDDD